MKIKDFKEGNLYKVLNNYHYRFKFLKFPIKSKIPESIENKIIMFLEEIQIKEEHECLIKSLYGNNIIYIPLMLNYPYDIEFEKFK